MLANALFCTALIALIATTMLSAGLAMTRATIHRLAATYVPSGYQTAISSVTSSLSADMQHGGLPSPIPSVSPLPAQCGDSSCKYSVSETVAFTTNTLSTPAPSCDASLTNCASGEQGNSYIDESRVTARITVYVTDANKNALLTRSADVTFRTLHRSPFVSVTGFRDDTFDNVASGNAAGDDGGLLPATPNPCASAAPGTSDDTTIRVAYQNTQSSACTTGSALRAQSYSQTSGGPAGWSP